MNYTLCTDKTAFRPLLSHTHTHTHTHTERARTLNIHTSTQSRNIWAGLCFYKLVWIGVELYIFHMNSLHWPTESCFVWKWSLCERCFMHYYNIDNKQWTFLQNFCKFDHTFKPQLKMYLESLTIQNNKQVPFILKTYSTSALCKQTILPVYHELIYHSKVRGQ